MPRRRVGFDLTSLGELRDRVAQQQERIDQLERNPQILKYMVPDNDITSPPSPPSVRSAPRVVR